MASGKIANLSVGVSLDAAEFTSGLTQSEKAAKAWADKLEANAKLAAAAIGGALAGGVAYFISKLNESADAIDAFNDLKDATGASIENISALDSVARRTGTTFESVESILIKYNKALASASSNDAINESFKALGLSVAELKKEDPAEALRLTAVAMAGFADDANKARLVQELFGKSVKEAAPFLKDLSEQSALLATTTADQAQAAEDYNKALFAMKAASTDAARSLTSDLLPSITKLIQEFNDGKEAYGGFVKALYDQSRVNPFASLTENITVTRDKIKDIASQIEEAQTKAAGQTDLQRRWSPLDGRIEKLKEELALLKSRESYLLKQQERDLPQASYSNEGVRERVSLPSVDVKAPPDKGPKDDPTKKLLENQLKTFEANLNRERDLLATRNKFIDLMNGESLMSFQRYYDARRGAQQEALNAELSVLDKELEVLRNAQAKADKATDRAAIEGKIQAAVEKRAEVVRKAGEDELVLGIQQRAAAEAYQKSIAGVTAQVLELQKRLGEAAAVKFDLSNESLSKRFTAEGNAEALKALDTLRAYTIAQADYSKLSADSSQVLEELALQEDRVAISRRLGATSELDGLKEVGAARQAAVQQLRSIVEAQELLASTSGNPALVLNAQKARVALEQLQASADPLGDKFNAIFQDGLGDAFADFVTGTKTASEAFKSFANSVISQMARIAAQSLAQSLMGSSSSSGGLAGILGQIFGSGASAGGSNPYKVYFDGLGAGTPMATGTNYVPYDGFQATLHKGEAVVPARFNPAAGGVASQGPTVVNNVTNNVASGVSRGEVLQLLQLSQKAMESRMDQKIARI